MSQSRAVRTYTRKDRKKQNKRFTRTAITIILALIITVCLILFSPLSHIQVAASTDDITYKTYVVQPGDTLWNIAEEHLNDVYPTYTEYIDEVERANNLSSDILQEDQLLIIPVASK